MTRNRTRWIFAGTVLGAASLGFWAANLQARSDGVSGRAQSPQGCSCHSTSPNASGVVTVTITGPQTVQTGSTSTYTVAVSGTPAGTTGGFDLFTSGGTFIPGTGSKLLNNDLVHSDATRRSWTFQWTAPGTDGTVNFYAVAQGTNGSGTGGDSWNWYGDAVNTPFAITVTSLVGVDDPRPGGLWLAAGVPNPTAGATRIDFSLAEAGTARLDVFNVTGRHVTTLFAGTLPAGRHSQMWSGRDDAGRLMPSGQYVVRLVAGGETIGRAVFLVR